MLLISLLDRLRQSRFLEKYATSAAMAEGSGRLARQQLTSYEIDDDQIAELRQEFKIRYHSFKTLLQANNSALENMAAMERKLQETQPFSFSFVKEKAISVAVDVFRMIRSLDEIVPGKYTRLYDAFKPIKEDITSSLALEKLYPSDKLVMFIDQCNRSLSELVGNKMANLGEIRNQLAFDIPDGFIVTSYATELLIAENELEAKIAQKLQVIDFEDTKEVEKASHEIREMITAATLPNSLKQAIQGALNTLIEKHPNATFALRSSATGEDTVRTSSAGQYLSKLHVDAEDVLEIYQEVIASKYSTEALIYRYHQGLIDDQVSMAVGCMPMVDSASGGVIYTCDPLDASNKKILIYSCHGLPKSIVDGGAECDHAVVSDQPPHAILNTTLSGKSQHQANPAGDTPNVKESEADNPATPSLTEDEMKELARLAKELETYFGIAQDIEWCLDKTGQIKILQSRPLISAEPEETTSNTKSKIESPKRLIFSGGITVSHGQITGKTQWVETEKDARDFPDGAILCIKSAHPRWAPLLRRASGVIAIEGGFAGHLATIAREYGTPCLFGVKDITSRLANGTIITLDADNREIYLGEIRLLTQQNQGEKKLTVSNPVHEKLKEVCRLITPLNLIDPSAADFRPSKCRTLHDITRFIHEKSVVEMFDFGRHHHFSERSAKQLYYKVPMQWWVLNLDDGFIRETSNRYVQLENIASLPMLALWKGMVAMPWAGPPPIDGRGFLSVMFQATTNRSLITSSSGGFTDKNYFMISKNFCNLSSRLGFHFTIIESIVSEESPEENFISFKYKGGAADIKRRTNRIEFLGELLEKYGFSTRTREDILVARLESPDTDYIKMRLVILGYLMIHTRQIDMIMLNNAYVSYYRSKFEKDIATLMSSGTDLSLVQKQ